MASPAIPQTKSRRQLIAQAITNPGNAVRKLKQYGAGKFLLKEAEKVEGAREHVHNMVRMAKIAADAAGYARRRRVAREIAQQSQWKSFLDPKSAYRKALPGTFEDIDKAIPVAREIYRSFMRLYPTGRINDGDSYSYLLFDHAKPKEFHGKNDLRAHPAIQDLCASRPLVEIASIYLGEVPILGSVDYQIVWPNDHTEGFQKFHIDRLEKSQLKVFIAVEAVDEGNGATVIVPADVSQKIVEEIGYKGGRIPDEVLMSEKWRPFVLTTEGPAGTAFFFDTSRSIHQGARARTRPRHLIAIQYVSKYCPAGAQIQHGLLEFDRERASRDALTKMLYNLA